MYKLLILLFLVGSEVVSINSLALEEKQPNDLLPKAPYCGASLVDKIFNGKETKLEEFPWMALLEYDTGENSTKFLCGGSLINNRYILTAAHCVTGKIFRTVKALVSVRLGEHNISSAEDCTYVGKFKNCNVEPQNIPVESIVFHEEYNEKSKLHDIALIRLSKEAQREDTVKPICLPNSETPDFKVGLNLTVAGWGKTEHGNKSDVKLKVNVPLVSDSECARIYAIVTKIYSDGQFCAGGIENEDSCYGDSGGPSVEFIDGFWYARGIVSFGGECGTKDVPGVYTRTSHYIDWIAKHVLP